ncbi:MULTISPECIES: hypothetical protein [unclassified Streptomyces]
MGKKRLLPRALTAFRGSTADGNPEPDPVSLDERVSGHELPPIV